MKSPRAAIPRAAFHDTGAGGDVFTRPARQAAWASPRGLVFPLLLLLLFPLLLLLAGARVAAASPTPKSWEADLGTRAETAFRRGKRIVDARQPVVLLFRRVADRLARQARPDRAIHVTVWLYESPDRQAYVFSNGAIYVPTGIREILYRDSRSRQFLEDEVAAVLSHEEAHVVLCHETRGLTVAEKKRTAAVPSRALLRRLGQTPPNREEEADLYGAVLCLRAGYRVSATWNLLARFCGPSIEARRRRLQAFQQGLADQLTSLWERAREALYSGRPQEALQAFESLNRIVPDLPSVATNMGLALLEQHDQTLSGAQRGAVRLRPGYVSAMEVTVRGAAPSAAVTAARLHEARRMFDRALQRSPGLPAASEGRALCLLEQGRTSDAEKELRALARSLPPSSPHYASCHTGLGAIEQRQGNPRLALREYDRALSAQADYTPALYNRALALEAIDLEARPERARRSTDGAQSARPLEQARMAWAACLAIERAGFWRERAREHCLRVLRKLGRTASVPDAPVRRLDTLAGIPLHASPLRVRRQLGAPDRQTPGTWWYQRGIRLSFSDAGLESACLETPGAGAVLGLKVGDATTAIARELGPCPNRVLDDTGDIAWWNYQSSGVVLEVRSGRIYRISLREPR